jgi:hypothetical protein
MRHVSQAQEERLLGVLGQRARLAARPNIKDIRARIFSHLALLNLARATSTITLPQLPAFTQDLSLHRRAQFKFMAMASANS